MCGRAGPELRLGSGAPGCSLHPELGVGTQVVVLANVAAHCLSCSHSLTEVMDDEKSPKLVNLLPAVNLKQTVLVLTG